MIQAVDTHACGEPGRVIVGRVLDVPGQTMFEKMVYLEREADDLRKLMLREPRGYPAANCNLILPPTRPEAAAGYVIMEQTEYPGMSGTNTIAVATVLIETGVVTYQEPVTELGTVVVDVSYGGMFYVIADAEPLGLRLTPDEAKDIIRVGEMIKAATQEQLDCVHPENPEIRGVTIAQLSAPPSNPESDRRNTVIVSTGKLDWNDPSTWTGCLDRSPCGTGTCAKMAALWAKGELGLDRDFRHEGPRKTEAAHLTRVWTLRPEGSRPLRPWPRPGHPRRLDHKR